MLTVCVIPAKRISQRLAYKNTKRIGSRTLVEWAVDVARESGAFDEVVVSSDDDGILQSARDRGVTAFERGPGAATPYAKLTDAVIEVPDLNQFDVVAVLLPTTPFRKVGDIEKCKVKMATWDVDGVVTVTRYRPTMRVRCVDGLVVDWQKPTHGDVYLWTVNGAVFMTKTKHLLLHGTLLHGKVLPVLMPTDRSIEIHEEGDLTYAKHLYNHGVTD